MELTHKDIQNLHVKVREWKELESGVKEFDRKGGQQYEIINSENSVTEAVAVAPVVNGQTDYSNTIILTAGTQDKWQPWEHSIEEVDKTLESLVGAGQAAYGSGLSPQYEKMDEFFSETQRRLEEKGVEGGHIKYSSAHSQAGVPNAKLSAKYKVDEVVNFYDWGAKKAVDEGRITASEIRYLNRHAVIYSDSGKALTGLDGNGGAIPYGQVRVYEGSSHNIQTPLIKGNNFNIEKYVEKGQFVSGMTEKQVKKVIEAKLKAVREGKSEELLPSTNPNYYLMLYKKEYGAFAPEPTRLQLIALNTRRIGELHSALAGGGAGMISLREELVRTTAQTAQLQAEEYEEAVRAKLAAARESIEQHVAEVRSAAYELAHNLSASEIEDLLADFTVEICWNQWIEAETLAASEQYKAALTKMAGQLNKAADKIVEADQRGAGLFDIG